MKWVPRDITAFLSEKLPIKLLGSAPAGSFYDIPPKGTWVITFPLYFAIRFKNGFHIRFGDRYDYVDRYYVPFEIATKRVD